ncbi:hypothetical protein [Listeria booriae]|uniref:hypothetical protein n=1 Tax=Listeria booriae TaxID=1552123 RepID=UPI001628A2C7|nr:hypothetical protein [Listeria booriae]MBC1290506.1 hypothetical protein [Listeria booriae]
MKLLAVDTQEKYDSLMGHLENEGNVWFEDESKPTEVNNWTEYKEETVIMLNTTLIIHHQKRAYFENVCPDVEIVNYEIR